MIQDGQFAYCDFDEARTIARNHMSDRGFTQKRLAKVLGVTQGAISRGLNAKGDDRAGTIIRILEALGYKVDYRLYICRDPDLPEDVHIRASKQRKQSVQLWSSSRVRKTMKKKTYPPKK